MRISDWSSDVCSSDLTTRATTRARAVAGTGTASRNPAADACASTKAGPARGPAFFVQGRAVAVGGDPAPDLRQQAFEQGLVEIGQRFQVGHAHVLVDFVDAGVHRADLRSEEHTSELQSLMRHSYAVFCSKKKQ